MGGLTPGVILGFCFFLVLLVVGKGLSMFVIPTPANSLLQKKPSLTQLAIVAACASSRVRDGTAVCFNVIGAGVPAHSSWCYRLLATRRAGSTISPCRGEEEESL